MGKSYSHDLRLRVVEAIDAGMCKMAAHRTFGVSRSTIDDWLAQREQHGHLRPLTPGRVGPAPAISDLDAFREFAARHSGCTLSQMSAAWQEQTGRRLSRNTFSLALQKIGWTRKKRVCSTPNDASPSAPALWSS